MTGMHNKNIATAQNTSGVMIHVLYGLNVVRNDEKANRMIVTSPGSAL